MSGFDDLNVEHGSLGSKSANISTVPEPITKLIDSAWVHTQEHPDQFHKVTLSSEQQRDEFHLYGKAAAKAHDPVLDYRKLPRPGEQDKRIAYFTLRLLTPETPRPGRKPATAADPSDDAPVAAKADDKAKTDK